MNERHISFWGRTLAEYNAMFNIETLALGLKILSVADGPSTFNQEMRAKGYKVTSVDPVYGLSVPEIGRKRV